MSQTVANDSNRLELDRAFRYAVTLAWQDFMKPAEPRSIRVEYVCEPGNPLDHLSVWSARGGGYRDLVCDFWTSASLAHPAGTRFEGRYHSDVLAQALLFVMKNQGQFTRPSDAGLHGLVLIHPPDADDRSEAATWMKSVPALGIEAALEEGNRRTGAQAQHQEEKAWTSGGEGARLGERHAFVSHESVEASAKTNASNHFELRYAWPE
jgi:hypothetical protein